MSLLCFKTASDQAVTVAWSLNEECAPFHSNGCSRNIKVEQVDVGTVQRKIKPKENNLSILRELSFIQR